MNELLVTDIETVINMSDAEFYNNFAFIMQVALVRDISLYTDLIDEMYEICERDRETLVDILDRTSKMRQLILDQNALKSTEISALSFGYAFAEGLKAVMGDKFNPGEYLSLGCVAQGFISWKKNWLTKDEYYELRDMFVPFYLPISVEMLDIELVAKSIAETLTPNENGAFSMALLKKIGKTVIDKTITYDDIKAAIDELNFDEAW